uniref:Uncharacterized protein n=1 Tax=Panagrolaimus sp. JU765 TaxID=591449 RepID=A0AC34QDA2_9BILA
MVLILLYEFVIHKTGNEINLDSDLLVLLAILLQLSFFGSIVGQSLIECGKKKKKKKGKKGKKGKKKKGSGEEEAGGGEDEEEGGDEEDPDLKSVEKPKNAPAGGGGAAAANPNGPRPPPQGGIAGTHDPNYQTMAGLGQDCFGADKGGGGGAPAGGA